MPSSQTVATVSASPAFYTLASSIDPRIPAEAAAQMLADFREVVHEATLREVADHFDRMADAEADRQGYRARVMRGAANDVRRLISGGAS